MSNLQPPPHAWGPEDIEAVMAMLKSGISQGRIAQVFNITRNAAIGRIARNPDLHKHLKHAPGKQTRKTRIPFKQPVMDVPAPEPPPDEPPPPPEPPERLMPLIETGSQFCKWPVKDDPTVLGGILCCGRPVGFEQSYCARHIKAAMPKWRRDQL